jgi:hypothetical protein
MLMKSGCLSSVEKAKSKNARARMNDGGSRRAGELKNMDGRQDG